METLELTAAAAIVRFLKAQFVARDGVEHRLVKGVFGMFRNPTAHEARVLWRMSKEDAEDLLSIASFIHRRIDAAR